MADASIAADRKIATDFIVSSPERAFSFCKVSFAVTARVKRIGRGLLNRISD
jgi:hypothetical protein